MDISSAILAFIVTSLLHKDCLFLPGNNAFLFGHPFKIHFTNSGVPMLSKCIIEFPVCQGILVKLITLLVKILYRSISQAIGYGISIWIPYVQTDFPKRYSNSVCEPSLNL